MATGNLPTIDPDKLCNHVYEEGHVRAGQRCGAFRTTTSAKCNFHSGGAEQAAILREQKAKKRKEMSEALAFDIHRLQTPQDVLAFYELLVNNICSHGVTEAQAKLLALVLPTVYKIAKDLKNETKGNSYFKMDLGKEGARMKIQFETPAQLDEFLRQNEQGTLAMMETMHREGALKMGKVAAITVKSKDFDLDKQVIDIGTLAEMGDKIETRVTKSQTETIFGKHLGDKLNRPKTP